MGRSKELQAYMNAVANLGCLICRKPAELHHLRDGVGMGRRGKDVIPLCPRHHRHGGFGVAYHAGSKTWQKKYGTEQELLEKVKYLLQIERGVS